jgi:hypothetical protein
MDTPGQPVWQQIVGEVEVQKGPDEITAYANIVAIMFGPDEVVLHFGLRNIDSPNKGVGIAKIYINPAHAKRLTAALSGALQQVESIFGEINSNPISKLTPDQLQKLQKK